MGLNDFLLVQEVFLVFPLTPNDDKNEFGSSKEDKKKKRIRGAAVPVEVKVENLLALTE